jgi:integrase
MPRVSLTERFVAGVKSEDQTDYFDDLRQARGLALRVSRGGRKTWTLLFTPPGETKRARMSLGTFPATTLAQARTLAIEARGYLEQGRDPRVVLARQAAGAMTLAALIENFLEMHARPNLRSAEEIERRLAKNVTPLIGNLKVADLHRRDMNRVTDPVVQRQSRVEAVRIFEDLRSVVRWAVARGDIDHNPFDGMKKPAGSSARERVLTDDEIVRMWTALPKALAKSPGCQRIIKLCLVTAQRVGEVSGLEKPELDLEGRLWIIPGERTKNGYQHMVPLSDVAVGIIQEAIAETAKRAKFVFSNREGTGPMCPMVVAKTLMRAQERFGLPHWTPHDLRRTAASGMAKLKIPPIVRGHVLNHRTVTKAGVTLGTYDQYDYADEKREALERWANHLASLVGLATSGQVAA